MPAETISIMAGHQLPLSVVLMPLYMVKMHVHLAADAARSGRRCWSPAGRSRLFQFIFATIHDYVPGLVLWPMTDIGGGIFSLVVTAIFLQFWKPKDEVAHYKTERRRNRAVSQTTQNWLTPRMPRQRRHAARQQRREISRR